MAIVWEFEAHDESKLQKDLTRALHGGVDPRCRLRASRQSFELSERSSQGF